MASSIFSSLSRSELKDILNIYRICFEAAVGAYRAHSVTAFDRHPDKRTFWKVHHDTKRGGQMPHRTHQTLLDAYKKWNMCDHFCVMVFRALHRHLKKYGAEVTWDIFLPSPDIVLVSGNGLPACPKHSVLAVQTVEGETFIFDCTREQFGWSGSAWLTEPEEFTWYMADMWSPTEDGATSLELARRAIAEQDDGYWGRIFETFACMWEKLKWDRLKEMEPAVAEELVRQTAADRAERAACETWGPKMRE